MKTINLFFIFFKCKEWERKALEEKKEQGRNDRRVEGKRRKG